MVYKISSESPPDLIYSPKTLNSRNTSVGWPKNSLNQSKTDKERRRNFVYQQVSFLRDPISIDDNYLLTSIDGGGDMQTRSTEWQIKRTYNLIWSLRRPSKVVPVNWDSPQELLIVAAFSAFLPFSSGLCHLKFNSLDSKWMAQECRWKQKNLKGYRKFFFPRNSIDNI